MTRGQVAAKVRAAKEAHPERYCSVRGCLWRVTRGPCSKHGSRISMKDFAEIQANAVATFERLARGWLR